jgi:hypothetical protein
MTRLLLVMLFVACGTQAQDATEGQRAELDEMEPAVSSDALSGMSAGEPAGTEMRRPPDQISADDDELQPALSGPVLAQDVRRRAVGSGVMDEIDLGRTEITGNQELPKVLYIVPWQKSGPAELMGKPVNTLLEEVLAPIDRTEFVRQVDYYGDLYGEETE